ncbi:MAG: hypothetical protein NTY38_02750 [Acidobacteria bacterium]|nr:hypothetical protein [Acidobacteriota bacterium]
MQSTAVVRQFTGIPINDCRPSQFRLSLLLRDLLAIRWYDVSDARLFGGFSTYTAVKGNWYSPGATAVDGDDVEVSEFQFGADMAVPAIAVLLTELGLPSLVATRQSAVRVHLVCPQLDGRQLSHAAGANFACELWANYPDPQDGKRCQAFSNRSDVLTYLEVLLGLLDAFDGCPTMKGLTVGMDESLHEILVLRAKLAEDRLQLNLKKWLTEEFHAGQLRTKLALVGTLTRFAGTRQVQDVCSLRGVYAVIRLLVFTATSWFALSESEDFKFYLGDKIKTGARGIPVRIDRDFLLSRLATMLQKWTDELLSWKKLRTTTLGGLGMNDFDPVLECAFLTLAYTHDRIVPAPSERFEACERARPDIAGQRTVASGGAAPESEARFWSRELRLEDNRHFPFEQTLHFWRIHEYYIAHKSQLTFPPPSKGRRKETPAKLLLRRRAEEACLRRWRELASLWLKAPADAQMMAAPFVLEVISKTEDLKKEIIAKSNREGLKYREMYDRVCEVQRLILAAASCAPSPHDWRRSLEVAG